MAWMLALLLVGSVLIGGGTAYASDAAVPGQPLYGLDRSLEEIQSELTSDPEAFVALQLAFADERLSEAQELASIAESEGFQEALDGYGESIAAIAQRVGSVEDIDLAALGTLIDESLSNHDAKLAALSSTDEGNGQVDCDVNGEVDCDENNPVDECDENGTVDDCEENGTPDNGDQDGDMDNGDKSENSYCVPGGEHPVALKLAGDYDVEISMVMDWFCGRVENLPGFGFGQIMHAIQTAELLANKSLDMGNGPPTPPTAEQLLKDRASGLGWGQIWQIYNLKGKPTDDGDPNDTELSEDDVRPEPPGQAKKSDGQVPPGQEKKADQQIPPGQAKKTDRQEPPGQAKKSDQEEPSDQDEESDQSEPPEQGEDSDNSESSEQDKKSDQQEPPGQAKKSNQQEPPGQAKKSEQQQGKKNKDK